MANVLPPQIDFPSHPVPHTPSPLGFGFGFLASNNAWHTQPTPGHHNPLPYQNIASTVNSPSIRAQKRRYEPEDDIEILRPSSTRDVTMERSPTPDRPRRIAPKRFRLSPSDAGSKLSTNSRESKSSEENDVDVGVLLGNMPHFLCHAHRPNFGISKPTFSVPPSHYDVSTQFPTFPEIGDSTIDTKADT